MQTKLFTKPTIQFMPHFNDGLLSGHLGFSASQFAGRATYNTSHYPECLDWLLPYMVMPYAVTVNDTNDMSIDSRIITRKMIIHKWTVYSNYYIQCGVVGTQKMAVYFFEP